MKKALLSFFTCLLAVALHAQVPQTINYQAVARNSSGQALANQSIKARFSFISNNNTIYSETWAVTTNALGLFNVQIGASGAINVIGDFTEMHWEELIYPKLKIELDINNSGLFTTMGTQDLSTSPYSFYSAVAYDTKHIGGYPVSMTVSPGIGSSIVYNGSSWVAGTPAKPDTSFNLQSAINSLPANSTSWVFVGSWQTLTLSAGQIVDVNGVAALASTSGTTSNNVGVAVCYQNTSGGTITPAYSASWLEFGAGPQRNSYAASATIRIANAVNPGMGIIAPGTYKIGIAVRNNTTFSLNNNDQLNGFIHLH